MHGSFKPSSVGLVDGRRALRTLLNWFVGRLISARRELTLAVRGDLASCSDCPFLGMAALVMMALLVGLSLEVEAHVVMPMVEKGPGVGLT